MSNVFMPALRRGLMADPYAPEDSSDELLTANPGGVFSPNVQAAPPDEVGHYEPNRSRSNFHYTAPDDAYQPHLASVPSDSPAVRSGTQDPYAARLTDIGNRLQSAYATPHTGTARQIFGALLSRKHPELAGLVSGETQRQRQIEPLQQEYGLVSDIISKNRAAQTAAITDRLHQAQTEFYGPKTQALLNPPPKQTPQEQALADYMGQINPATKKNYTPAEALKQINQDAEDVKADKTLKAPSEEDKAISDLLASKNLPNTPPNRDKARSILKTRDRAAKDPELADLGKQLKKAQLEKAMEATPDEQRRADLANNLEENLTSLEDIAKRRPELFGPFAGRKTTAKQWIGSSDPDVAALKVIEEQTGLAMVGAHAMRNAQHAEKAAQSITGANKNTADVLLAPNGPIARARQSIATFKSDAGRRRAAITGETPETTENAGPPAGAKVRDYTTLKP